MTRTNTVQSSPDAADVRPQIQGQSSEYFHSLLRSLRWPPVGKDSERLVSVGFTSCLRGEGVSTFAMHAAIAAAATSKHRVLIVDANLDHPTIHETLKIDLAPGIIEVLLDQCEPPDAIQASFQNLSVMAAGEIDVEPASVFGSNDRLYELLSILEDKFDLVIFDLPPIGTSDVTLALLALLDGVVLVVESERVDWDLAGRVKDRLQRGGVRLLGAAVNKRRRHVPSWVSPAF